MTAIERILGPSATRPPLPPFYPLYARRFRFIASSILNGVFSKIDLPDAPPQPATTAEKIVLYANHPGFWDPLLVASLTGRFWPGHAVLSPIETGALRRHRYFHGLGFFPVEAGSGSGLRDFLSIAGAALKGPGRVVLAITPEGRFSDPRQRPLTLQRGLGLALARHAGPEVTVLPLALEYHLQGESPRPRAQACFGEPLLLGSSSVPRSREAWHEALTGGLEAALDCLQGGRDLTSRRRPGLEMTS